MRFYFNMLPASFTYTAVATAKIVLYPMGPVSTQTEVECTCGVPAVPCSVHWRYTAAYAGYLQQGMVSYGSILYTAHTLPASGSVPAAYTAATLPVHSTSVWAVIKRVAMALHVYCDVPGSPCLSKNGSNASRNLMEMHRCDPYLFWDGCNKIQILGPDSQLVGRYNTISSESKAMQWIYATNGQHLSYQLR